MGRKVGLRINTKRFGSMTAPCTKEMVTLLTCLARCNNDNEKCVRQKQMLSTCMKAQPTMNKKKPWGSINYHLQRLSKGKK
ncbi:uncharacterized protein LOC130814312 [Amaranthus tricolor]|uniref:uncharacterized protein LOC130814312 n=1 Tax=Amaranthus tricolor TaxID=29722 RepID=UPI00258A91F8|nr:uncharacterized protein LOC130814312 [Amaranthus tricolor]XP_057536411.1 uncharacterized protein LOC130814312 [Amaranthus tricolor]